MKGVVIFWCGYNSVTVLRKVVETVKEIIAKEKRMKAQQKKRALKKST